MHGLSCWKYSASAKMTSFIPRIYELVNYTVFCCVLCFVHIISAVRIVIRLHHFSLLAKVQSVFLHHQHTYTPFTMRKNTFRQVEFIAGRETMKALSDGNCIQSLWYCIDSLFFATSAVVAAVFVAGVVVVMAFNRFVH